MVREAIDSLVMSINFDTAAVFSFSFSTSWRCLSSALNSLLSEGVAPSIFLRTCSFHELYRLLKQVLQRPEYQWASHVLSCNVCTKYISRSPQFHHPVPASSQLWLLGHSSLSLLPRTPSLLHWEAALPSPVVNTSILNLSLHPVFSTPYRQNTN